jgi:hypothetical protein
LGVFDEPQRGNKLSHRSTDVARSSAVVVTRRERVDRKSGQERKSDTTDPIELDARGGRFRLVPVGAARALRYQASGRLE